MVTITVARGPNEGMVFRLTGAGPHLIGRHSPAVKLSDNRISWQHARIRFEDGRWLLQDLQSKTGTSVDGRPVDGAAVLSDGSRIRFGHSTCIVNIHPDVCATHDTTEDGQGKATTSAPPVLDAEHEEQLARQESTLRALVDRVEALVSAHGEERTNVSSASDHDEQLRDEIRSIARATRETQDLLPRVLDELQVVAGSGDGVQRIEESIHDQHRELAQQFRNLVQSASDRQDVLHAIRDQIHELASRHDRDESLDGISQRIEQLADNREHDALLADIRDRVGELASTNGHDQKLDGIAQRVEQLADARDHDELLADIRDRVSELASRNGHDQKLDGIAQRIERLADGRKPDELRAEVEKLAQASHEQKDLTRKVLEQLLDQAGRNGESDQTATLSAIRDRVDALADDGHGRKLAAVLEHVEVHAANDRQDEVLAEIRAVAEQQAVLPRILNELHALVDQAGDASAGGEEERPTWASLAPSITRRLDTILDAVTATATRQGSPSMSSPPVSSPPGPPAELLAKLFAAVRFLQIQQQRNNQLFMRIASVLDPTLAARPDSAPVRPKPPAPPAWRIASWTVVGALFTAVLGGLVCMITGIARQTLTLLN